MKIAVNTRLLRKNRLDGLGRFASETLERITANHPEHEFIFFFDRKYDPSFVFNSNVTPVVVPPPTRHPFLWKIWFEYMLPAAMKKHRPGLFLSPDGWLSLKTNIPSVPVIHDLNFEYYPQYLPKAYRKFYQKYFPQYARKATRIATVSEFSKKDIASRYQVPENKIDVVYNGPNDAFRAIDEKAKAEVRKQFTGGAPFFLFVSSIHPRKNISRLLQAFDAFKELKNTPVKLVLAGHKMWWSTAMEQTLQSMNHKEDVIFTGRVNDRELQQLMASAEALTYLSLFEGFGIPLVEAMQCGTPVLTSDRTSMPEVGGDAVLYANPEDINGISRQMARLAEDEKLRGKLSEKGKVRARRFSWEQTAERLWKSIEKAADEA